MKGLIFNIKRYAIHDGPGIRVTFFMKGCPLGCWWCHNPEGIGGEVQVIERVDRIGEKEFTVDETVGKYYSTEDLVKIARKDLVFIEESGGGVTFSGGEPLLQASFLAEALRIFRDEEIHTAVDTSGYAGRQVTDEIIPLADLFLFDIKHLDPLKHKKFTGVSNELIIDNYKYILEKGKKVIIRIPVIPGFNDDSVHLEAMRDFVTEGQQGGDIRRIDLLPYHRIGSSKYRTFGLEYRMKDVEQPSAERMNELKEFFAGTGIRVKIGG
jgi:pyruvate formate lyase activating enzyme